MPRGLGMEARSVLAREQYAMIGVLVGLLCATTWASASVMMKELSEKLDPFTLNASRALTGGLSMLLVALVTGKTAGYHALTPERLFFLFASVGIGGGIGDTFYISSLPRIGVSRAFPIASTYPALTLLFGLIFLHERVNLAIIAGLVLVLGGIMLVSGLGVKNGAGRALPLASSGVAFALVASLCWGAGTTLVAPGIEGLDSLMVASVRTPAYALVLCGIVALRKTYTELFKLSRKEWLLLVSSGFMGWGLGSVLFLLTISLVGPTRGAILTSTAPLFALPLSVIFLKERVNLPILVGTVLTVAGIVIVS